MSHRPGRKGALTVIRWTYLIALAVLGAGCTRGSAEHAAPPADPELLHTAMEQLTDVIVYDIYSPPQASRTYAYASIAAYEALRHDRPGYQTLAGRLNGLAPVPAPDSAAEYSLPLAGLHAFITVGKALTASQARMDSLRTAMHRHFRRAGVSAPVAERSIRYGDRVAEHVLAWAAADRYAETRSHPKFAVLSEPGRWIPTPPAYLDAVEPHWAALRPFVLDSASQFRPRPPVPFDMAEGSPFRAQVTEVYEIGSDLSAEQRAVAAFWDCNPYVMNVRGHAMFATKKITPGGHWMGIVGIAARRIDAGLVESAAAYARTSIALADAFISSWDEKYRSNLLRPETVINAHIDESWQPLLQTPPFPEYTSGHSVISTAAAAVLTDHFGEGFAFDDDTEVEYGLPIRSFESFADAAAEAAISRLYGGIHYRMAIEEGVTQGRQVGELVVRRVRLHRSAVEDDQAVALGRQR
jgi:hypothetical protein